MRRRHQHRSARRRFRRTVRGATARKRKCDIATGRNEPNSRCLERENECQLGLETAPANLRASVARLSDSARVDARLARETNGFVRQSRTGRWQMLAKRRTTPRQDASVFKPVKRRPSTNAGKRSGAAITTTMTVSVMPAVKQSPRILRAAFRRQSPEFDRRNSHSAG